MAKYLGWLPYPYKVKSLKLSSSLDLKGQWQWELECSIRDECPTRFAQMMNLA